MQLPAAESAAQSLAGAQGMLGAASNGENVTIALGGQAALLGGLFAAQILAGLGAATLGSTGPTYGPTLNNAVANALAAQVAHGAFGKIGSMAAAQALLSLGTSNLLANSGRQFLLSTFCGL